MTVERPGATMIAAETLVHWADLADRGVLPGPNARVLARERAADLLERHGDDIGRAMHEASQVGGPWTPCTVPYGQWPECEHQPMGQHVALILDTGQKGKP